MKQNTFFGLIGMLLIMYGIFGLCRIEDKPKETKFIKITEPFKPLYNIKVDPKQDSYIILNGEIYDTVPHGKLEEYIQNDNL